MSPATALTSVMSNPSNPLEKVPVKRVDKPWGHELIFAHTERYAGKLLVIKAGHRLSRQYHQRKDEAFFVQSGRAQVELETPDGEKATVILEPGDALRLTPGVRHLTMAVLDTVIFEVSTPELDDVVRLSDDYGRTNGR
jgi:mannose-6-phosphate isomerase